YPNEMTIVIQYQFWGLEVDEEAFEVTLSFNKVHERLRVPFAALTGFVDPSERFGLQFKGDVLADGLAPALAEAQAADAADKAGQVVALDAFRKK
ncbi:MAG: ClpXP protease specificity-enhancing factor SspB, partial [Alphaproteobacteria bacterium]